MIASLAAMVMGWGVPARLAKPFVFVMGIALLVALLGGAKCAYDQSVIDAHDAKVEAAQAKADKAADNAAAEQRDKDKARGRKEFEELKDVQEKYANDPVARKRAFYRCVRLQQAARQNGVEPPSCV